MHKRICLIQPNLCVCSRSTCTWSYPALSTRAIRFVFPIGEHLRWGQLILNIWNRSHLWQYALCTPLLAAATRARTQHFEAALATYLRVESEHQTDELSFKSYVYHVLCLWNRRLWWLRRASLDRWLLHWQGVTVRVSWRRTVLSWRRCRLGHVMCAESRAQVLFCMRWVMVSF